VVSRLKMQYTHDSKLICNGGGVVRLHCHDAAGVDCTVLASLLGQFLLSCPVSLHREH